MVTNINNGIEHAMTDTTPLFQTRKYHDILNIYDLLIKNIQQLGKSCPGILSAFNEVMEQAHKFKGTGDRAWIIQATVDEVGQATRQKMKELTEIRISNLPQIRTPALQSQKSELDSLREKVTQLKNLK